MKNTRNKSRRTFSLSHDAVAYLESYRHKRKEGSLSGAVEAMIRERRDREEQEKLAAQTRAYYDSLQPAELEESEAWGAFGESELSDPEG
jgi:hypothetical protein